MTTDKETLEMILKNLEAMNDWQQQMIDKLLLQKAILQWVVESKREIEHEWSAPEALGRILAFVQADLVSHQARRPDLVAS